MGKKNKAYIILAIVASSIILLLVITQVSYRNKVNINQTQTSKSQAENLVKELPEVKKLLDTKDQVWIIESVEKDESWSVQVGQLVSDGADGEHIATFNWYKVNKFSPEVVCSMFTYDKQGDLVKEDSFNVKCV